MQDCSSAHACIARSAPAPKTRQRCIARLNSDATLPVFGEPQVCMRNAQDAAGSEKGTSRKGDAAKLTN